ncbi:MAG TPA: acetyl-CoA carboxylase biotin carboxylase subunit, partial [Gammaproteobacteria bacterium]|nr:acetyl-CoA carboxylase biotin carboxylase subunit [Gammaproteobacteria bacterium]
DQVLRRSRRALEDIRLFGLKTTIPYQLEILKSAHFQSGKFDTSFVESHPELINYSVHRSSRHLAAALGAAVAAHMGL